MLSVNILLLDNEEQLMSEESSNILGIVKDLIKESKYSDALEKVELILEDETLESKEKLTAILLKGEIKNYMGDFNESLIIAEEVLEKAKVDNYNTQLLDAIALKSMNFFRLGEIEEGLSFIDDSLKIVESIDDVTMKEELTAKGRIIRYRGLMFLYRGQLDQSLDSFFNCLSIFKRLDNKDDIAAALNDIGIVYRHKGEMSDALKYYEQSLVLMKEIGRKSNIGLALNNIGVIYNLQGELEKALEKYFEALLYFRQAKAKHNVAIALTNIGETYTQKGNLDEALKHYLESLQLKEEIGNNLALSTTYFNLIVIYKTLNKDIDAYKYVKKLQIIAEITKNKGVEQRAKIGEAVFLKNNNDIKSLEKVEEMLEESILEQIVDHDLTVFSLLKLCEIYYHKLRLTGQKDLLSKFREKVDLLLEIAKLQNSYFLLSETYWLQSLLYFIENEPKKAQSLLWQAQLIAEEHGLIPLAKKISQEHDKIIATEYQKEEEKKRGSILEKTEEMQLNELVLRMLKREPVETEDIATEEPVLLLLLTREAHILYTKQFISDRELKEGLIKGFLVAVNHFLRDSFSSGTIERIKHIKYTIIMKFLDPIAFVYVFTGESYPAIQRLNKLIDEIEVEKDLLRKIEVSIQKEELDQETTEELNSCIDKIFKELEIEEN